MSNNLHNLEYHYNPIIIPPINFNQKLKEKNEKGMLLAIPIRRETYKLYYLFGNILDNRFLVIGEVIVPVSSNLSPLRFQMS